MPYARIQSNLVQEVIPNNPAGLYHPGLLWVQTPQGVNVQVGWSYVNGQFSPPPTVAPTPAQVVAQILRNGLTVTSTSTADLNATYNIDDSSRANIVAIETSLNAGRGFPPKGAETFDYPDRAGNRHTFSQQQFTDFAAVVRDFYYACTAYASGLLTDPPTPTATID